MLAGERRLTVDELQQICRRHSLPFTVQRRTILETLAPRSDHPTADQIFDDVRKRVPEISRTTVYRVMETLVEAGIARKVCHPGAAARYEMETQRHHHLVCLRCEAIVDLQDPSLDSLALPKRKAGFHIEDYSIQFRGVCPTCATKQNARQSAKPLKGPLKGRKRS